MIRSSVQLLPPGFVHGSQGYKKRRQEKKAEKYLPAAFPHRRTVIFFDWDDTLCPTTWIRSLLKETLADYKDWEQGAEFASGAHDDALARVRVVLPAPACARAHLLSPGISLV